MDVSVAGPLGQLAGMTYDTIRKRYFPTPKVPIPPKAEDELLLSTECGSGLGRKKSGKGEEDEEDENGAGPSRRRRRYIRTRGRDQSRNVQAEGGILRDLTLQTIYKCGRSEGENITSVKTFVNGSFYATTDTGNVIIQRADGHMHGITICSQALIGMHCDIPRLTWMAISGGDKPHVHLFQRNPDPSDLEYMSHNELPLPPMDVFGMSSFDNTCVVSATRSLMLLNYADGSAIGKRNLPSDPMSTHIVDPNLVYTGLRNGSVTLEDLRVSEQTSRIISRGEAKARAVVKVKRLDDAIVPWGVVVSRLSSQLMLYDVRFGKTPLQEFKGHVNTYRTDLGLATSPGDRYVFAAGADNRIRAWSTMTGERVLPEEEVGIGIKLGSDDNNPLKRIFADTVADIQVREDWGLDVAVKGEMLRFDRRLA